MLEKTITISGREVRFRASAATPRLYRAKFRRDIFRDLSLLQKAAKDSSEDGFEITDLELFENVAYIMAFQADDGVPASPDAWLDQFDMLSIYEVLPELLELWGENVMTESKAKKNHPARSGR